jgi:hypothetical protein
MKVAWSRNKSFPWGAQGGGCSKYGVLSSEVEEFSQTPAVGAMGEAPLGRLGNSRESLP